MNTYRFFFEDLTCEVQAPTLALAFKQLSIVSRLIWVECLR